MVPPISLLGLQGGIFRHFGPEVVLSDNGSFRFLRLHDAERFAVTSFWEQMGRARPDDHKMSNYMAALEAAKARLQGAQGAEVR